MKIRGWAPIASKIFGLEMCQYGIRSKAYIKGNIFSSYGVTLKCVVWAQQLGENPIFSENPQNLEQIREN